MTATSLERSLGGAARELLARIDAGPRGGAIRTQAAVVRSLIDEIERRYGSDTRADCLREQAREELVRLMQLMTSARSEVPLSVATAATLIAVSMSAAWNTST